MTDKLAEEILDKIELKDICIGEFYYRDEVIEAMQAYHEAKLRESLFDVSKMLTEIIVSLNNGEKIKAIKCSECDCYFEEKEIQIQGDLDTCDDCLCPE